MNNQLQRFDNDGIELIINTQTGESFATIRGYARMSGKPYSTIQSRTKNLADNQLLKEAQIKTAGGLQGGRLIPGKLAIKWLKTDNPNLLEQLSEVGWNVYCHKLAGFEVKFTAVEPKFKIPATYGEALLEAGRLALELEAAEAKLLAQEPLVKLSETLTVKDKDAVSIGELAKAYNIGRTTFFTKLRDIGFIMKAPSRLPYQKHIEAKRAEVLRKERFHQPGIFDGVTVITAKGQEYIASKLTEKERAAATEVLLEATVELIG